MKAAKHHAQAQLNAERQNISQAFEQSPPLRKELTEKLEGIINLRRVNVEHIIITQIAWDYRSLWDLFEQFPVLRKGYEYLVRHVIDCQPENLAAAIAAEIFP